MNHYNTIGIDSQLDWPRIRKLFCIGLFAACLVLEGDMLLGWSVADENAAVFGTFSKYIGLSEQRVFWSAFLGLVGIPLEILCYFGIYRLIADNSMRLAHIYRSGFFGNIVLQWLELLMNDVMIGLIALTVEQLWQKNLTKNAVLCRLIIILITIAVRWVATKGATRMSYLASRTVKRVMREQIYQKLLRLGTSYREHASTVELVQESVEGVEQLESYFGQYVPQFFYAFLAPVTLFALFGLAGSWKDVTRAT